MIEQKRKNKRRRGKEKANSESRAIFYLTFVRFAQPRKSYKVCIFLEYSEWSRFLIVGVLLMCLLCHKLL